MLGVGLTAAEPHARRVARAGAPSKAHQTMKSTKRIRRQRIPRRLAMLGALGAVLLAVPFAGCGEQHASKTVATAPSGAAGRSGGGDLHAAAVYLGVSPSQLRGALRSGKTLAEVASATSGRSTAGVIAAIVANRDAALSAAANAGEITRAQESARVAGLTARIQSRVNRRGGYGVGSGGVGGVSGLATIDSYLGLTAQELRAELRAGRTLAQVADARSGRSSAGLIAALVAARRAALDAAVSSGKLTRSKENQLLSKLSQRVTAEVYRPPRLASSAG
jgi:hypothetical protein